MKKNQPALWMFIASMILFTGFKKNTGHQNNLINESAHIYHPVDILPDPVKVSIANATAIKSDKGQKPLKVMVYLSKPATEPVTVKYSTEDGTAKAGVDYVATNGTVTFNTGEVSKWITVFIIGEVAADPDEDAQVNHNSNFKISISQAKGALIDAAQAIITMLQNVAQNPSIIGAGGGEAIYEVCFVYTGYTSFYGGTAADCSVRASGTVALCGYLRGKESLGKYDDTHYMGTLELVIDIDVCSVKTLPNGESKQCFMSVSGSGTAETELKIVFGTDMAGNYDGRGGYIKTENKDGRFVRTVSGTCDQQQTDEERAMIPNESIVSVFNGKDLPMLLTRTLRTGIYSETDDQGNKTEVNVLRKIR
jgi:hypothetical protein